jgi:hypothetical protein
MSNFTGKAAGTFPDPLPGHNYEYRTSNYWCDVLVKQANEGKIAEFTGTVTEKEAAAQEKANEGYVVIGAYRSENKLNSGSRDIHPHFATVQPGFRVHPEFGLRIANVGDTNGNKWRSEGFPGISAGSIRWYYNPNQNFQYKPEILDQYRGPEYLL